MDSNKFFSNLGFFNILKNFFKKIIEDNSIVIFLIPMMTTPVIMTVIWRTFFHESLGPVNDLLGNIGIKPILWLSDPVIAKFTVIIVDDASTINSPTFENKYDKIKSIKLIRMKENRGHARCNAAGLKYILEKEEFDFAIPMDGDGEDRPEELKNFIESLEKFKDEPIVGKRIKRSEGIIFRSCYFMHKLITSLFTGKTIKYGNYTCLPKSIVEKMVNEKATWSSFSGSLAKVAEKKIEIPSIRGARYYGPSKMSFLNLIKHSISIIAVFKFNVLLRSI